METLREVGIITFHAADNYGAVLQAYALQQFLSLNGIENEIIDFSPRSVVSANNPLYIPGGFSLKRFLKQLAVLPNYFKLRRRCARFNAFRTNNFVLSPRLLSPNDISRCERKYRVVITGSDQVFNPLTKYAATYYLRYFKNVEKVAYAPSFGIRDYSLVDEEKKEQLKSFYRLSCREADGAAFLSEICGEEVPTVLDPVFLLSPKSWIDLANSPMNKKYIFVYDLNGGKELIEIARRIKDRTGLPIICVSARKYALFYNGVDEFHLDTAPEEFLGYVKDAEYVVTDSFHGSAFSLLFRKKVLSYVALKNAGSRILNLFNQFDLGEQIINRADVFKLEHIEFKEYDSKLEKFVGYSRGILLEMLTVN